MQMLVQIPLLASTGWLVAHCLPSWLGRHLDRWNRSGIAGLLLALLTFMVWMLPLVMDASLDDPRVALAKYLSVPLLIGAPVALSWPIAGFVVRGVVLVEVIATAIRLGWLYLMSPVRLCSNYLLGDQERLGKMLIALGFAILAVLAWRLMWGHVDPKSRDQRESDTGRP